MCCRRSFDRRAAHRIERQLEGGWRCGEVVLSIVADHARAAWSARCARRYSSTGCGWPGRSVPRRPLRGRRLRADTFVAGTPEARHDEVVSARSDFTKPPENWNARDS